MSSTEMNFAEERALIAAANNKYACKIHCHTGWGEFSPWMEERVTAAYSKNWGQNQSSDTLQHSVTTLVRPSVLYLLLVNLVVKGSYLNPNFCNVVVVVAMYTV